ncbi:bifunctional tetrahydrofolate synthase/dihydrofolate synthase [Hahella sp. KA22]|uniref:bifunctional tetrahydrofolate synthase/dihydrofolate synthase n=1 Tax=Hahella sp. KA22 TaxID=1628392 RepID=UPI000FDE7800|nr:bifunctional tetrahydrofolate synthase/dihydrofolate synthase [Hahella sp. KA22]AZZ91719.1 bifunctional tetrahydrofolate synthase/dihydrofolate synthase [Hahella sp. KA22]QAY55089.1 bifunctional tetrahydrofolate synthase/dihydrofolate synthase [Hahella sp. KA22]
MEPRRLSDWLDYVSQLHTQVIEMGLDRVNDVFRRLCRNARLAKTVVTLAGTNGKGSTLAAVEALALAAGKTVGAYTSPHILRFNERVRINGVDVSDEALEAAFAAVETARGQTALTYFEFTTLVGFYLFQQARLDVVLLEVGLGGRLDAVNIVDPDLAVITSVDLDHQEWLGDSREDIGREKAGILRPGIPLVIAEEAPPTSVVDVAGKLGCATSIWRQDFTFERSGDASQALQWRGRRKHTEMVIDGLSDNGLPMANMAAAIQAAMLLNFSLSEAQIVAAIAGVKVQGRFQLLRRNPEMYADVGHNPHAARYLKQWLAGLPVKKPQVAVFSALKDKDVAGIVKELTGVFDRWFVFPLNVDRAMPLAQLAELVQQNQPAPLQTCDSLSECLAQATSEVGADGRIVAFGSFFTVAEIFQNGMMGADEGDGR